jgi:hypothetical protein
MLPENKRTAGLRCPIALLCSLGLAGCSAINLSSNQEQLDKPPNARGLIIDYRALLWRDLASIRNASIAAPQRQGDTWRVCVRLDIKGSLGTYTGERDYLVALYGVVKRPELIMEDASSCAALPHEPFPELEGGYLRPDMKAKPLKPDRK